MCGSNYWDNSTGSWKMSSPWSPSACSVRTSCYLVSFQIPFPAAQFPHERKEIPSWVISNNSLNFLLLYWYYYCLFHCSHKCRLLKEGAMILSGLSSLQLLRDPQFQWLHSNCLIGLPAHFMSVQGAFSTWPSETKADYGFAFSVMFLGFHCTLTAPQTREEIFSGLGLEIAFITSAHIPW